MRGLGRGLRRRRSVCDGFETVGGGEECVSGILCWEGGCTFSFVHGQDI